MRARYASVEEAPVVVVSGASSGIGRDAALFLNELGYTVAAGIRHEVDGERLRSEATSPERLHPVLFDVTSDEQVEAARRSVEELVADGRSFAGVFSNAGLFQEDGDVSAEGTPMAVLERLMDVNFFGAVRFVRAFLPLARTSRGTVVVNSALMARTVLPFNGGYAASKQALEGWVDSLRREIGPYGVRVVLVEAGGISTGLINHSVSESSGSDLYPAQRPFQERSARGSAKNRGDPRWSPRRFSEAVAHALQAAHPRPRYHLGGGAGAIYALGGLPDTMQDRLLGLLARPPRRG